MVTINLADYADARPPTSGAEGGVEAGTGFEVPARAGGGNGKSVAQFQDQFPAIVQIIVQYIRSLRNGIIAKTPWLTVLASLRKAMESYL